MATVVLKSKSSDSLNLLVKLARKLGIEVSILSEETSEDIALINAMKKGKTGQTIDTSQFLHDLQSDNPLSR